ncbi:MAG TPA: bifunctional oligoribonuclease/PAP phosphatase NrnA [Nitrospiria bacterium]|jgi:phosphoesterase RecJ-like protein
MAFNQIVDAIQEGQSFLITTHMNPEGDALGSSLGLALALRAMKKEALIYNVDSVPRIFHFLPFHEIYQQKKKVDGHFDTMFVLDCGDSTRTGLMNNGSPLPPVVINIDHHVTNKNFGNINWIDPEATATAEMIYDLLIYLNLSISPEIALSLYTALFTETGSFRFSNTTPKALRISAELLEKGVEPYWLSQQLYEKRSLEGLKLLGEGLTRMGKSDDGKIAWIMVTQDLLKKTKTDWEDSEDFVNYPRSLAGVEIAVFFRELGDRLFKVSFRSKNQINVAQLAEHFGGGGHRYAAGCQIEGDLDQVKKKVLDIVTQKIK